MLLCASALQAQEPYAVLNEDKTVLTFYYDTQKAERNGMSVGPFSKYSEVSWYGLRSTITTVVFDATFANCTSLTSTAYWFYDCSKLTTITGIENLKTDNVKDMQCMFYLCRSLTSLDVSGFKTDNVTDMSSMFTACSGLTSLDVSGFKTDNVTNMGRMFSSCSSLTSLDVSGFKTDNVTIMSNMFSYCSSLTSLDVSGFNTDKVTDMTWMFNNCSGLTSLDVSGFKTDNVTEMGNMFGYCSSLTSLDVSGFKTDNVTDMGSMFFGCSGLTSLDISGFKTDNVTNFYGTFSGCSGLTSLDLSGFKTDKVTYMQFMFQTCSSLSTIYASDLWTTDNVKSGLSMFGGCKKLVGGQGTTYNSFYNGLTYARIDGGTESPGYFTYKASFPTNINGLNAEAEAYDDNAPVYNLSGQRVATSKKGIYIRNGRKIVIN